MTFLLTISGCTRQPIDTPASAEPVSESAGEDVPVDEDTVAVAAIQTPVPTSEPSKPPVAEQTPFDTPEPSDAPSDTPEPSASVQPYTAQNGVYTIAWMSDPQHYSKKFPEYYYAMTQFLRDHCGELNLKYVINTGDLVDHVDAESEWNVAVLAQSYIDDIPNGVLAGNHDMKDEYKAFSKYFGKKHYEEKPWYGGSFEDNRGHFDLLTIGETDYLFVYMGFAPNKNAYQWVIDTFRAYPDRIGILCLHDYYTKTQTLSEDGQVWYDRVVKKTPNLYMVLCGHKYGAYCFPETFDDDGDGKADRTVYQMLFNYQALDHGGGYAYLRLMQIDEKNGTLHNLTYSPLLDDFNRFDVPEYRTTDYETMDETHEEFILPLPWTIDSAPSD